MLLAALWCSTIKPTIQSLLKPVVLRLKTLATEGVKVHINGALETARMRLLLVALDLPAKALVMNFHQYNGECGCQVCEQEGETMAIGRGHTRVYGYEENVSMRAEKTTVENASKVVEHNLKHVKGVKCFSVLHVLQPFDLVSGVVVDYMHCVLLGVIRKLLSLWFNPSNHCQPC